MRNTRITASWRHGAFAVAVAACALLLAACATDYRYVRPAGADSGGYYTSSGPYSGASGSGYYDSYGTGPYYSGTSGWGYYNGSSPYVSVYGGYYDYPGWNYWPGFGFGVSNVWNFPGYWGPWYGAFPRIWRGCHHRHCDRHHDHHNGDAPQDLGVVSVRPTLPSGHTAIPQGSRKAVLPDDFVPRSAGPWLRDRAELNHERFIRAPTHRPIPRRPDRPRPTSTYAPRPLTSVSPVHQTPSFSPSRNEGFRAPPRVAPQPTFQPHAAAPERTSAPRPRDFRNNDGTHRH